MQVDASSTYFGPVPCPCDLVPMGEKQEKEVFHEKHLMVLDENYEEPLESKDLKSPEFSMEKADLKSPKVFSEDLDLNSPSFSMEPSMKRRKKHGNRVKNRKSAKKLKSFSTSHFVWRFFALES